MAAERRTTGVILRRYSIGEADRLLLTMTRELGKVPLIARGLKKPRSKLAGQLEPWQIVELRLIPTDNYWLVVGAEAKSAVPELASDLELYTELSCFIEVYDRLIPEAAPDRASFELLTDLITGLGSVATDSAQSRWLIALASFRLLAELGYLPDYQLTESLTAVELATASFLTHPVRQELELNHRLVDDGQATLIVGEELICSVNMVKFLRLCRQLSLPALQRIKLTSREQAGLSWLVGAMLRQQLDRPLMSDKLRGQ